MQHFTYERKKVISRQLWTVKEDKILCQLIEKYGKLWTFVSSYIEGRDAKSCRERWLNKFSKRKRHLSLNDKYAIIEERARINDNKWSKIADKIGCTSSAVKNFWHAFYRSHGFYPVVRNNIDRLLVATLLEKRF